MNSDEIIKSINDKVGKGSMMKLSGKPDFHPAISSGSLGLDLAIGIGGFPEGRIIEIVGVTSGGKTTLAIHAIAEWQKKGRIGVMIDAEHAFDRVYAQSLGVDIDNMLISQPDNGEQALEIVDALLDKIEGGIIVVDSVAALVPRAEIDGEMGDSKMGLHARLMSQAMRKLTARAAKSNNTIIFINQIREKIGVLFGCLHGDMKILFTDGRSIPIKKVVEQKICGKVWCFNEEKNKIEESEIIDWHYNGKVNKKEDFLYIETQSIDGCGRFGITVTPDHKIMTKNGWVEAKNIKEGDMLLSKYESILTNEEISDFIKGCIVGDSTIAIKYKNSACIKFQDKKNQQYCDWKKDILSHVLKFRKNGVRWESEYTYEFAKIKREIENRNPLKIFNDGIISDLSLAIWMMDDGHFQKSRKIYILSIKRFSKKTNILKQIKKMFCENGLTCNYNKSGSFIFTVKSSEIIANRIYQFVHESMKYKLPDKYKEETCTKINIINEPREILSDYVEVLSKRIASDRQLRQKGKYDISIKDNHNYFSGGYRNGVLFHNSPETTPGGNALKFYASVRLDVRRQGQSIKDKDGDAIANKVKINVIKNKMAPPFKEAEFEIEFGVGISKVGEIIDIAEELDIIKKSGSWYSYNDAKISQGRDAAKKFLLDNPELSEEIEKKIKAKIYK